MLSKKHRLAKELDLKATLKRGRSFFNPFFNIKFLPGPQKRFAVVVSTKVYKQAVKRNRLKRIVREHIRKNLAHFRPGYYVIMAKPKITSLPEEKIIPALADSGLK